MLSTQKMPGICLKSAAGSQVFPPWSSAATWREANQTIELLVRLHFVRLKQATRLAFDLASHLAAIFPQMNDLCARTCRWCPDPCCLVAKAWIDFQDLLFLHLSGQSIPPSQLLDSATDTCRFLGVKGCRLPRIARPWICTRYLCPPQMVNLRREPFEIQQGFNETIQNIKLLRRAMEAEFIRVVSE